MEYISLNQVAAKRCSRRLAAVQVTTDVVVALGSVLEWARRPDSYVLFFVQIIFLDFGVKERIHKSIKAN